MSFVQARTQSTYRVRPRRGLPSLLPVEVGQVWDGLGLASLPLIASSLLICFTCTQPRKGLM